MEPCTFEREMKKWDGQLRLRQATLGSWYFIERKAQRESKNVPKPNDEVSIDRYIRDREGYVLVLRCLRGDLCKDTLFRLRDSDMWKKRYGRMGFEGVVQHELIAEEKHEELREQKDSERLQDEGTEVYDYQMSKQGSVVYPGLKGPVAGSKK